MKKILTVFCLSFLIYGCGSSDENPAKNEEISGNVQILLGTSTLSLDIPSSWEKVDPFADKGIIFLARDGSQNVVITHEEGFSDNLNERISETIKENLSMVEEVTQEEDYLKFRGKLSATTPLREFYQKPLPLSNNENFLLISCSQEVSNLEFLSCIDILSSASIADSIDN